MSPDRPIPSWHLLLLACQAQQAQKYLCCTCAIFFVAILFLFAVLQEIPQFPRTFFCVLESSYESSFLLPANPLANRILCVYVSLYWERASYISNQPCHQLGALQTPFPI